MRKSIFPPFAMIFPSAPHVLVIALTFFIAGSRAADRELSRHGELPKPIRPLPLCGKCLETPPVSQDR
jgi:hypothetical protein